MDTDADAPAVRPYQKTQNTQNRKTGQPPQIALNPVHSGLGIWNLEFDLIFPFPQVRAIRQRGFAATRGGTSGWDRVGSGTTQGWVAVAGTPLSVIP